MMSVVDAMTPVRVESLQDVIILVTYCACSETIK
jgi:hypothetical protein